MEKIIRGKIKKNMLIEEWADNQLAGVFVATVKKGSYIEIYITQNTLNHIEVEMVEGKKIKMGMIGIVTPLNKILNNIEIG